ncbi:MAG: DUF3810 domain-containing protein [Firmicutes bacterium]|nr:DUF3810 domain-containing protein [Bacillota bacterium]
MKVMRDLSDTGSGRRRRGSPFAEHRAALILAAAALILTVFLAAASRGWNGFAEWYAVTVYPVLVGSVGRFFGLFPFSVLEFGIVLLILLLLVLFVRLVVRLVRKKGSRGRILFGAFSRVLTLVLCLATVFMANCGVNYYRTEFSAFSGLTVQKSGTERLIRLCTLLAEHLNELAPQVEIGEDGLSAADENLRQDAVAAMNRLGEEYPVLQGYYPQPKPVAASRGMSYLNITGVYSPFTIEANYNCDTVAYTIPVTVCHELSHLRGFMREDEANFIGYLACVRSGNTAFAYSGEMLAYVYASNALWSAGEKDAYRQIAASLPEICKKDLQADSTYWKAFETPVAQVSSQVNNSYLQANGQTDGVKSYGRFVDLLLAYYVPEESD